MDRIVVIGNLGNASKPDGQTMRTATVLETVKKQYSSTYDVVYLPTGGKKLLGLFFHWNLIKKSSKIVILPGYKAISVVAGLINLLGVSDRVIHVAIGGWLPNLLEKNKGLLKKEKKYKAILVQMDSIRESLNKIGLENAVWFPNYRNSSREGITPKDGNTPPRKFLYYSRVTRAKGVFEAVNAIKRYIDEGEEYSLDIYGPIDEVTKEELEKETENYPSIKYHRVLHGEEILPTLSSYDCMLFPTCYEGEGFPGAILESMMAGVPVIATDWKYNKEIVKDGETGLLCGNQSVENVYNAIKRFREDDELYKRVCLGAFMEADKYTEEKVTPILINAIDDIKGVK